MNKGLMNLSATMNQECAKIFELVLIWKLVLECSLIKTGYLCEVDISRLGRLCAVHAIAPELLTMV